MSAPLGVLLLTFGSAVTADDVPQYLASVRAGRAVPDDVVSEFQRRYDIIGRSPLIDITREQARDLQQLMESEDGAGSWRVEVGMLHSKPRVAEGVGALVEAGVRDVVAVVLAPQYSPIILAGYERAIATARDQHPHVRFHIAGAWHTTPEWIDSLADRLAATIADLPGTSQSAIPVIFTAHSLPRAVVDRDPGYIDQLKETAQAVAARAGLPSDRWFFAYQSAGHTPEEWLTPDVKDLLPELRRDGHDAVVIAPVQFLADHLEILYDIDVAARAEAELLNMTMHRIDMPNTSPTLVRALAAVARRERRAVH
ncbi:MAG TPA: ferrochelatase [Candidatus Dormibacteraeota bacterium]